jgi:hypothetical protein
MKDYNSLSHSVWDCKYHIIWIEVSEEEALWGSSPVFRGDIPRIGRTAGKQDSKGAVCSDRIHTKKVITAANDSSITACGGCEVFRKTAEVYAGKTVFIVLDNAKYQKCNITRELAEEIRLKLVFIPPYSPNLNFKERLWKLVKGNLRSRCYNQFELFREQIDSIIDSTDNLNKEIVDRVIGEKVQLFGELIAVNENSFRHKQEAA